MAEEISISKQSDNKYLFTNDAYSMKEAYELNGKKSRSWGAIYTPPDFAKFLTSWAIRHQEDTILDVGIGEGAFVFAAYHQLRLLGASDSDAQQQIFGAEIDPGVYNKFTEKAIENNINFLNLKNGNFFDMKFPLVDAIVGNPPYVRRTYIKNVDEIRQSVVEKNLSLGQLNMTRMTDLYIYFLLRALPLLKSGGKLAVITSDPWLNVGYGEEFKKYLQEHFFIEKLISLDRRVFDDAQVKPVLVLATKKEISNQDGYVQFIRIKNGLPIGHLQASLENIDDNTNIVCSMVKSCELKPFLPWGIHFKASEIYEELELHSLMTHMRNVAETRIGLQTLAKEFFVLSSEQIHSAHIEKEFLTPLAQSIRYFSQPVIDIETKPDFYLFYCGRGKSDLRDTNALKYILKGEVTQVEVRGKGITVKGYHNKERIKRSHRKIWYDLKSSLQRRGRASILIPRLVYRNFMIIWNKAQFVPGELFIEFIPPQGIDTEVYLAILTSSVSELMLRIHAQIYGGGTFNINPGRIKEIPMLDPVLLSDQQKEMLKQSYLQYLLDKQHDRSQIDKVIQEILGLSDLKQQKILEILEDLLILAVSSKQKANPASTLINP